MTDRLWNHTTFSLTYHVLLIKSVIFPILKFTIPPYPTTGVPLIYICYWRNEIEVNCIPWSHYHLYCQHPGDSQHILSILKIMIFNLCVMFELHRIINVTTAEPVAINTCQSNVPSKLTLDLHIWKRDSCLWLWRLACPENGSGFQTGDNWGRENSPWCKQHFAFYQDVAHDATTAPRTHCGQPPMCGMPGAWLVKGGRPQKQLSMIVTSPAECKVLLTQGTDQGGIGAGLLAGV